MATAFVPQPHWLAVAMLAIASSSALYTWIWYRPGDFVKLGGNKPCKVMARTAHVLKVIQFLSCFACTDWALVAARLASPMHVIGALLLCGLGQHLNYRVYALLGEKGVYYGFRFGEKVPWASAWPYSHLRDPQYLGCLLTLAGQSLVGAPLELMGWWAANYLYLMWLESKVPGAMVA